MQLRPPSLAQFYSADFFRTKLNMINFFYQPSGCRRLGQTVLVAAQQEQASDRQDEDKKGAAQPDVAVNEEPNLQDYFALLASRCCDITNA